MQRLLSQLCYVYMVPGVLLKMILYAMWYDAMALAYNLLCSLFLLLKSFFMATMRNVQTKIAIVYMREQTCGTRYDMIPI